ncbi:MAG: aldose 1-epimerase [Verrucomicrobiae bacterium]|nr:aldose 1-epimerase [Verrucomicrobiae bacterium]
MRTLPSILFLAMTAASYAGSLTVTKDEKTGWDVYVMSQGETVATFVPAAGANVQSIVHRGAEYLHQPEELSKLPGVRCGTPVLYPTPNRIKGGQFEFEGHSFVFQKGPGNHIHGLVNDAEFHCESTHVTGDSVSVTAAIRFDDKSERGRLFPFEHTFRLKVSVLDGAVRWDYEVDNDASDRNLPFGVALHPYIKYHGSRKDTYLHVPAESLMESVQQLPTGKLLSLDGHKLDARQPVPLEGYQADDVFFGMIPAKPAKVEFRNVGRSITFEASKEFTHLVIWTPDHPFMGIENQTCSTDAHNLASLGKNDVAHLQICPPGEKRHGWVTYHFE